MHNVHSLDESCISYINKLLIVETHYGYGWNYPNSSKAVYSNLDMQPIPNFMFRLKEFNTVNNFQRKGGIGIIEDGSCMYDGAKIMFEPRYSGSFNFDSTFPDCNIHIQLRSSDEKEEYDKSIFGWGTIKAIVEKYYQNFA